MKICALLVPREMKVEHATGVKAMSDEEIEQAIEAIQTMLAARAGEADKVIEGALLKQSHCRRLCVVTQCDTGGAYELSTQELT